MTAKLGNRSSAFNAIYPTNNSNGILQVESVSTVDNILLATYRATANGVGYAIGDIIYYRQIGSDPSQYYNGDTVIATPNPNHLGPLSLATNVIVTSTALPTGGATSTLQTNTNTLLTTLIDTVPSTGPAGTPSPEVVSVQGVNGGTPVNVTGNVTSVLSAGDNALLNDIKQRLINVDNKLVTDNPIGAVRITNGVGSNAVTIQDGNNSITVDGAVDLIGASALDLASIDNKIPAGLATLNNRLLVDNTQQTQPISGTVTANTGLLQPMTDAQLRATPPTVQLTNLQLNTLTPPAANTNFATETTLVDVLDAVNGNVNFNETIWTDDSGLFFARRVTQVGSVVTVNYYLPNGSGYTPGLNPRPVFTDNTKELITSYYLAIVTALPNYSNTNTLIRVDILDTTTSTIISTIWFNSTTQTYIPAPLPANVQLLSTDGKATASNQVLLLDVVGTKGDPIATTDTGTFSIVAFIKRALQNWTSLLQRIPTLGPKTQAGSIPVTLASDQPTIPVSMVSPIVIDTTLLAKEGGGNLAAINTKLPASLGAKVKAGSLSVTSPVEGLDVKVTDGTNSLQLLNLVSSKPIPTAIVDGSGAQITSFGGGVQYTEGDIDTTITGTASLWEDTGNVLTTVSASKPLPVNVVSGVDVSLLAKEAGGNLETIATNSTSINTKLPVSVGVKAKAGSLSVTSPTEGLDVKITDGTNALQLLNLTNSKPIPTAIVDGIGNQITSFGGGVQYTEGDVDTTITGTALFWEDAGNTLSSVSNAKPLPINIVSGNNLSSAAADSTTFSPSVSLVTPLGGLVDDVSPSTIAENRTGALRMSPNRALHVNLRDASGNEITSLGGGGGGSTQYIDGATQATPTGGQVNWNESGTQRGVSLTKALPIQPGTGVTFPVTQSGTWNLNNISGTISLPTGASTSALQTSGNTLLTTLDTTAQTINTTAQAIETNTQALGTNTSNTTDLTALLLDPSLNTSVISLLKTIAVTNRQLSVNTQVWDSGTISDVNSGFDKSFTIPVNTTYHILFGTIVGSTDGTVFDRNLKIEVIHTTNEVIHSAYATTNQSENTTYTYAFSGNENSLIPSKNHVSIQMPMSLILYAGQRIRFYYDNGQGADTILVYLQIGIR